MTNLISERSSGLLVVLSAPSGTGKTTLSKMLLNQLPEATVSISYTTRKPRGSERDGVDYHFVDALTFQAMINGDEFIEWAEVHGNFYGSSWAGVDQSKRTNGVVLFDIDVQGGSAIKRKYTDAVLVFILPPSIDELERRLRGRGTDSDDVIHRRMLAAQKEIEQGTVSYDYLVINDQLTQASDHLRSIVTAERCRASRVDLARLGLKRSESKAAHQP